MKHTIEYDGQRKTVEAKRTATVAEVLELAWPGLTWRKDFTYDKVKCIGDRQSQGAGQAMSEFMFGVCRERVSAREGRRRDRICREEGGYGYTEVDESHGTAVGGRWIGWFSGPNHGDPFDQELARRVIRRVEEGQRHTRTKKGATV